MSVIAVRYEGTLATRIEAVDGSAYSDWIVNPDVKAWIELERDRGNYVHVVSVAAGTTMGLKLLRMWLADNAVEHDEVWSGFCLPEHDVYVDNRAVRVK